MDRPFHARENGNGLSGENSFTNRPDGFAYPRLRNRRWDHCEDFDVGIVAWFVRYPLRVFGVCVVGALRQLKIPLSALDERARARETRRCGAYFYVFEFWDRTSFHRRIFPFWKIFDGDGIFMDLLLRRDCKHNRAFDLVEKTGRKTF